MNEKLDYSMGLLIVFCALVILLVILLLAPSPGLAQTGTDPYPAPLPTTVYNPYPAPFTLAPTIATLQPTKATSGNTWITMRYPQTIINHSLSMRSIRYPKHLRLRGRK